MTPIPVYIVGRELSGINEFKKTAKKCNFVYDNKNPKYVFSIGGDGTVLYSERQFPGILKVPIRDKSICMKCEQISLINTLEKLKKKKYKIEKHNKIEAIIIPKKGKKKILTATSDIIIRTQLPNQALRFNAKIDNKDVDKEIIGDGVVVATTFGSTGYFKSITNKSVKSGLGIAFNNTTNHHKTIIKPNPTVKITIIRNLAHIASDNDEKLHTIKPGDKVIIKKSKDVTRIVRFL